VDASLTGSHALIFVEDIARGALFEDVIPEHDNLAYPSDSAAGRDRRLKTAICLKP
jgi:hypothetical protein